MRKIAILIFSYNRPEMLLTLLQQIKQQQNNDFIKLFIIDDGSNQDMSSCFDYARKNFLFRLIKNSENKGKVRFYQTVTTGLQMLKNANCDYYITLPDDVELVEDFFNKSIMQFNKVSEYTDVLNILTCNEHHEVYKSVGRQFQVIKNTKYFVNDFYDLAGIFKQNFLDIIEYRCNPTAVHDLKKGSQVGGRISQYYLAKTQKRIIQTYYSLLIHKGQLSVMNYELRLKQPCYSFLSQN